MDFAVLDEFHEASKTITSGTPIFPPLVPFEHYRSRCLFTRFIAASETPTCLPHTPSQHHRARCHHAKNLHCIWNAHLPPTYTIPTPPCQMPSHKESSLHLERPPASHIHRSNTTVPDTLAAKVILPGRRAEPFHRAQARRQCAEITFAYGLLLTTRHTEFCT